MFALSEGPARGWTSPEILVTGIIGVVLLVILVFVELRLSEPMIQLRLLSNRLFRTMLTTSFFASAGFLGILFLAPLFLQEARGLSPLQSGLATFPEALGVLVSSQVVARVYPRIVPRRLMIAGMIIVACSAFLLATVSQSTNIWLIRIYMFLVGVGMANIFIPNQAAALATISREQTGRATTLTSVQRQIGSSIGIAVISSILAFVGPTEIVNGISEPNLTGYRLAFIAAAGFAIIGGFLATQVPDKDAAITMVSRRRKTVDQT
ncbi:MAG: MFS transporter [Thermomicrobiales bacterium]